MLRALLGAAALALSLAATAADTALHFSFTAAPAPGAVSLRWTADAGAPRFDAATGYGFVERTSALPARTVHVATVRSGADGATISEPDFEAEAAAGSDDANHYGLAFRIAAPPGAYAVRVRTTVGADEATVSISGLQKSRLLTTAYWDAASLLPHRNRLRVQGRDWPTRATTRRAAGAGAAARRWWRS